MLTNILILYLMLDMLTSTSGLLLEKAYKNDDCCLTNGISASEDGSLLRSPLVKWEGGCEGGLNKTFQQWVDYTASTHDSVYPRGLCFESWKYLVKSMSRKLSINNSCLKMLQNKNVSYCFALS